MVMCLPGLPIEIWAEVFKYLSGPDLYYCRQVTKPHKLFQTGIQFNYSGIITTLIFFIDWDLQNYFLAGAKRAAL